MKISLLLLREPFGKILEESLARYYSGRYNISHKIEWRKITIKDFFSVSRGKDQKWYCNQYINSIYVRSANPTLFGILKYEYTNNPIKKVKTPFQKLYYWLATNKWLKLFFSTHIIRIYPPIPDASNMLIIGGNRKIRILNIRTKEVTVLLKSGFSHKYIENELYIKENQSDLSIPKSNIIGADRSWYSEEMVRGNSPDRISSHQIRRHVIKIAIANLHIIMRRTLRSQVLGEYLLQLKSEIFSEISNCRFLNSNEKNEYNAVIDSVIKLLEPFDQDQIALYHTHGDFQEGNILYDGENVWLMDWEYSAQRSLLYDAFVLLLKARFIKEYSKVVNALLQDEAGPWETSILENWPHVKWASEKYVYMLVFLLEELQLRLKENSNPLFYKPSFNYSIFLDELKTVIQIIKNR